MNRHSRKPSAVVTFDYLWSDTEGGADDEVGKAWVIHDEVVPVMSVAARAYDDDGELYYRLMVMVPAENPAQEYALGELLSILGRHAGVTSIRFAGRPELDVG